MEPRPDARSGRGSFRSACVSDALRHGGLRRPGVAAAHREECRGGVSFAARRSMNGRSTTYRSLHPYDLRGDRPAAAHQGADRGQGHRHALPHPGGRARGRAAESGQQADLRRRPHGRHDHARQQPLRPVLRLAAHRRVRRMLLGRQPHAAVRAHGLQGGHRRGQGRRARLPGDQRGGRAVPRRLRPLGHGRVQGRGRDPRAHAAQEGPGLRDRAGRREAGQVRLRQQQLLAPARPRRPRRRVRVQEPQGHRLARREEGRGRPPGRLQGRRARPHRAHQGRPGRRGLPARRHAQHGAHHERRQRVPHALLAQGQARELRAHHRRDHARRARHRQPDLPAVRVQVRQAQHGVQGPPQGSRR